MFHVKLQKMQCYKKIIIVIIVSLFFICDLSAQSMFSQEKRKISLGASLDYGAGKNFNNHGTTVFFNYRLLEKVRISPLFTYFFNKDKMKMKTFNLNFHYLLPKLAANLFPVFKNHDVSLYPITGFLISSTGNIKKDCSTCYVNGPKIRKKSSNNFGFDFGVGVEYKIPTLLFLLCDMNLKLELKYQTLDNYSRPLVSFGLLYDF